MNILIISIAFPPRNSPGAQRPYSWAKYWSRAGHHVVVLTTFKNETPNDHLFAHGEYDVITAKLPQLEYISYLSPIKQKNSKSSGERKTSPVAASLHNIKKLILSKFGHLMDPDIFYLPAFLRAGRKCARSNNFDIMISTFNPGTSHWVARRLNQEFHIPWVADFRDLWSPPGNNGSLFHRLNQFAEKQAIAGAYLLMTVSEPLRQILQSRYKIPCVTVENGFDAEEFNLLAPEPLFPPDGKIRFVYTGAIYGARDPRPLFAALRELIMAGSIAPEMLEIIFYGRRLEAASVWAKEYRLEQQVKLMGLVDRPTALRAQRDADALILLEGSDGSSEGVLTSKIFEYFMAAKPVLGIGITEETALGKLLINSGIGFPLGNSLEDMKTIIDKIINQKNSLNLSPDWPFINQYSREKLAYQALDHIKENLL